MVRELLVLDAHGRHAQAVAFSPDGTRLVSVGMDALVKIWEVPGFRPIASLVGHRKCVNSVVFAPDGQRFATCSTDGTTRVWSSDGGRAHFVLAGQRLPQWSPDGRLLTTLSRPGQVAHWDSGTGEPLGGFKVADRRLFCLAFPPHDDELLVGGTGTIHRVRLHDGTPLGTLQGHGVAVASMALSPDRGLLASTGAEGELRLWDTAGWQPRCEVPLRAGGVLQLAWMPQGDRIAVSCDHVVQIVPVREGDLVERLEVEIKGMYGVAVSPDGRWLANAGADGRLRIWRFSD
ncbi:MAG: WD40 repeat domain-containing protein [Gemmatimonadota bacterium]|nr:WD40 repeat domain-containing protein [Gemmatimonadota bacterium]